MLRDQDFNDDRKDAGEIGAGHSVTAIYEIVPAGVERRSPARRSAEVLTGVRLRARAVRRATARPYDDELLTVKLRYKAPDGDESRLTSAVIVNRTQPMTANLGLCLGRGRGGHAAARLGAREERQLRGGHRARQEVQGRGSRTAIAPSSRG